MSDGELADYIFFFSSNTGLLIPADVDAFMEAVFLGGVLISTCPVQKQILTMQRQRY